MLSYCWYFAININESSSESLQIFSQSSFKSHYNIVILNVSSQWTEMSEVSGKTHHDLNGLQMSHGKSAFRCSFFFFFIAFSSITSSLYFTFPALNVRFIKLQDVEFLWLLNLQYVTNAHPNTDTDSKFEKIESHSSEEGVLCPLKVFSFSVWTAFKSCFKIRIVPFLLLKS